MSEKSCQGSGFHVHSVLEMIGNQPESMSIESMAKKIREVFGEGASFYSCSQDAMTIADVIEFLFARNKLSEVSEGKFHLNRQNVCNH